MNVTSEQIKQFQEYIWNFYKQHERKFPWRHVTDPYTVVVSEIMLQQTQTHGVEKKYSAFVTAFPNFYTLANASLHEVLLMWQGLGYNRRGLYLQKIAQKIVAEYDGILPNSPDILVQFPGIGKATAASICTFAFNSPTVFIETNIRTVFIHTFFPKNVKVADTEILPLIQVTMDTVQPRDWYYALMDYGVYLKKMHSRINNRSMHYKKQSTFNGSDRQIRGMIVKKVIQMHHISINDLVKEIDAGKERIITIIDQLCKDLLLQKNNNIISTFDSKQ